MKIIYAGLRAEQYNPKRAPSFEYVNFYLTLSKMRGVEAVEYPFDTILTKGKAAWNTGLIDLLRRERADALFVFMYSDELDPKALDRIRRETKAKVIGWFADDYWRFWNYSRFYAPHLDLAVTTSARAAEWYVQAGLRNAFLSQWAANPKVFHPVPVREQDIAVSFIGQYKPGRAKLIRALGRAGIGAEAFGMGWPNGRVAQEKLPELYCRSKINLNFNDRPSRFDPWVLGRLFFRKARNRIVPDPHLIRNAEAWWRFALLHIHARPFEILACRGFLISGFVEGMERYYEDGKELVRFDGSADDLAAKVKQYLAKDSDRARIAEAGYIKTITEHTYDRRFRELFMRAGLPAL